MKNYIYIPIENCPVITKRFVIAKVNDNYKLEYCCAEDDDDAAHTAARQIIGSVIIDTSRRPAI